MHTPPPANYLPRMLHLEACSGKEFVKVRNIAIKIFISLLNWSYTFLIFLGQFCQIRQKYTFWIIAIIFLRIAYTNMTILVFLTHGKDLIHPKEEKLAIIQCSMFISIYEPCMHGQLCSYRGFYISTWNQSKQKQYFFQSLGERNHTNNCTSLLSSPPPDALCVDVPTAS